MVAFGYSVQRGVVCYGVPCGLFRCGVAGIVMAWLGYVVARIGYGADSIGYDVAKLADTWDWSQIVPKTLGKK